jgi:hypothetical protein
MTILGWYENLPQEDMPPRWMWHLNDDLERHFEKMKAKRSSGSRDNDDEEWAPGATIQNEYARGRGRPVTAVR